VAKLAGVPDEVIAQARQRLRELEAGAQRHTEAQADQLSLFSTEEPNPAVEALRTLDPDGLSPREALEMVYRLKDLAG
jgi:DNA mismatch repair protein MutS